MMLCVGNTYSTENNQIKKCGTLNYQLRNSSSYHNILFQLEKYGGQYTSINRIMNNNNMIIDYGYIKDNLPKHLISFTHEIAGKQYKIPILIGHETIYNDEPIKKEHCDEKYNIFFLGVKPFENDNTVYIFLKNNKNYYYLKKEDSNKETVYNNLFDAITDGPSVNKSSIKGELDVIYNLTDVFAFYKNKLDDDWLEFVEYKDQLEDMNKTKVNNNKDTNTIDGSKINQNHNSIKYESRIEDDKIADNDIINKIKIKDNDKQINKINKNKEHRIINHNKINDNNIINTNENNNSINIINNNNISIGNDESSDNIQDVKEKIQAINEQIKDNEIKLYTYFQQIIDQMDLVIKDNNNSNKNIQNTNNPKKKNKKKRKYKNLFEILNDNGQDKTYKNMSEVPNNNKAEEHYEDMSGILVNILDDLDKNISYRAVILQYQNQSIEKQDIINKIRQYLEPKYSKIFNISDDGIMRIISYLMTQITLDQLNTDLATLKKNK